MDIRLIEGMAQVLLALGVLSTTPAPAPAVASGPPRVTTGVPYAHSGAGATLRLDLYRPPSAVRRTAVIWLHGSGPPAPRSRMGYYADHFARLGYVSATIDYSEGREVDAMAAVRWVRRRASALGVYADRVFVGGYSSGARAAIGAAEHGRGLSRPDGAISISGYGQQSGVRPDSAPLLMLHGDRDVNIPYSLGRRTCSATLRAGVSCRFITLRGAAHSQITYTRRFTIWPAVDRWLRASAAAFDSGGAAGGTVAPD
jgi:acetyl esterase/lipase